MFALLSVIECPDCGQAIPFTAMTYDEPDLSVRQCSNCGLDIQIRHGRNERTIVEPLKKQ